METNIWIKSTRSNPSGNCVSVNWKKSTRSGAAGHCVEVRSHGRGEVQVRDTKLGEDSPILIFTESEWKDFTGEIKKNITCPTAGSFEVWLMAAGYDIVERDGSTLSFTNPEWDAFIGGVHDGEFDLLQHA